MRLNVPQIGRLTLVATFVLCFGMSSIEARADEHGADGTPSVDLQDESAADHASQRRRNRRAQRQRWIQGKQQEWWTEIRQQLFVGIDLTSKQTQEIESILEGHLARREKYRQLHKALATARHEGDGERASEIRLEVDRLNPELVPSISINAMRETLTDEQRPKFDMNRAKALAEAQVQKEQNKRKRNERAEVD